MSEPIDVDLGSLPLVVHSSAPDCAVAFVDEDLVYALVPELFKVRYAHYDGDAMLRRSASLQMDDEGILSNGID